MCVMQDAALLHDPDAPVEVGRKSVAQVVRNNPVAAGEERLVTHHHAGLETFPGQRFRSGETAHAEEMPFFIYDSRFSVYYIRQFGSGDGVYHLLQGIFLVQGISGIQKTHVVSCSQTDALVHGVIQSVVRLADYRVDMFLIFFDDFRRAVFRPSVHNDVFHIPV